MPNTPTKRDAFRRLSAIGIQTVIDVGVAAKTESLIEAYPNARHLLIECNPQWIESYRTTYAGIDHRVIAMEADQINRIDAIAFDGTAVLKVDVDGGEIDVLIGTINALDRIAIIAVEATADSLPSIVQFAEDHRYRLFDIVELCYCGNQLHQCDLIFVAESFCHPVFTPWDSRSYQHFE